MSDLLIKNATVVLPDSTLDNYSVLCQDGKIAQVAPADQLPDNASSNIIDAKGQYLAPGFIDMHIHGTGTHLIDKGPDELAALCQLLPAYGVTGFLPSVCPLPKGKDAQFLATLSQVQSAGTAILGFHLEGPFLSITGALSADALGNADSDRVLSLIESAKPYKAIFSISPEFKGITDLIAIMAQDNTPVFMTHTSATVKQTQLAIEAGARHATHFYDVFPNPKCTDPGVRPCGTVEAILADPRVSVDFILDGEHADPVAAMVALRCKGPDRVCLITDANVGAGLPPGRYPGLEGNEIEFAYPGAPARMTENSSQPKVLAGSGLTMDRAVRNALKLLDIDLPQAIRMASTNPAQVLHLENKKGKIAPNFDADLVLLNKNLEVTQTFIAGKCCYNKIETNKKQ